MIAGATSQFSIWRISEVAGDDVVGGALITGTPLHTRIRGRIESIKPTQLLLEQGLEYSRLWNVAIQPSSLDVRERDELEITHPADHLFFGERFRILAIEYTGMRPTDSRNFLQLTVRHVDFARSLQ